MGGATLDRLMSDSTGSGMRLGDLMDSACYRFGEPFGALLKAFRNGRIVVLDTETTGLGAGSDEIVELAYCVIERGVTVKEFSALLRTNRAVGSSFHVHGISDEEIAKDGIPPSDAFRELASDCCGAMVAGHNLAFDLGMIRSQSAGLGMQMPFGECADTCEISRRLLHGDSFKLGSLAERLGLAKGRAHRALGDVRTTIGLLKSLIPVVAAGSVARRRVVSQHEKLFRPFAEKFCEFRRTSHMMRPAELLSAMLDTIGVNEAYANYPSRMMNLRRLVATFREMDEPKLAPSDALRSLVRFASLAKSLDNLSERDDKVVVVPVHQSKGLEFHTVFIAGAVEGSMPSFNASDLEEEKRIFYVAMTRPKRRLFISGYREFISRCGKPHFKDMSPFISKIDKSFRADRTQLPFRNFPQHPPYMLGKRQKERA